MDTEVQGNDVENSKTIPSKEKDVEKDGKPRPPPVDIAAAQNAASSGTGSGGVRTPTSQTPRTPGTASRYDTYRDKERKIGHRRVGEGGQVTYKKIGTSQLMGSIQLGIQHAVGSLAGRPEVDLLIQDFYVVETIYFPSTGTQSTPAHPYSDYRFKVYAPIAFRHFRDLFRIAPDDYLISLCNDPLRELSNPGASGSIFYLTMDDEFIIKTVQHKEAEFLQKLLPGYYMNLNQNPRTLLPKFFGLYNYQCNAKNIRLIVMNNLLPSSIRMHQRYDLKGSTYKRKASKYERSKTSPTYKDLDFMDHHAEGILLEAETYKALINTIARDCRVLASFKIMDYSLLVGIHNLDQATREKLQEKEKKANGGGSGGEGGPSEETDGVEGPGGLTRSRSINRHKLVAHSTAMESIQADSEPIDEQDHVPPGGIPARNSKGERLLLFLGIIDILQSYRLKKKLEHTFKSMIHDGDTISVHRPNFYAQRFQKFMAETVFKRIPSPLRHSPSRRRGPSMRLFRPVSQSEPVESTTTTVATASATESHDASQGQASQRGAVAGSGGVDGDAAQAPITTASGSTLVTSSVTSTATGASVTATSTTVSTPQPSTPVNLPAVLQDRPLSSKCRVPPPVPPRSPRGVGRGGAQGGSFSLSRGGLAYFTLPPSPRFAGDAPHFAPLCSPSIGMAGYGIWHAESMRKLSKRNTGMVPVLTMHPSERYHSVWQLTPEEVVALSPCSSRNTTPHGTPKQNQINRKSIETAMHSAREIWGVLKTVPYSENKGEHERYQPACLSRSPSIEHCNTSEFILPDTHISASVSPTASKPVSPVSHHSECFPPSSPRRSPLGSPRRSPSRSRCSSPLYMREHIPYSGHTYSQSGTPYDSRYSEEYRLSGARSKTPTKKMAETRTHVDRNTHARLSQMDYNERQLLVYGSRGWKKSQDELNRYPSSRTTIQAPDGSCTRHSFAGTQFERLDDYSATKRQSLAANPSGLDEDYIEKTLASYLVGQSRSPSPTRQTRARLIEGVTSHKEFRDSPVLSGQQTPTAYHSSPALLDYATSNRMRPSASNAVTHTPPCSPLIQKKFYTNL